ncbi:MAG: sigma-70 family RNA polymerase sigma factor [Candidatus Sulfotelmatobacter sp.]
MMTTPDADDIVQEVFVRIHRNLDKIQKQDRLTAWIFQITRNAIADYYRSAPNAENMEPDLKPASLQEDSIELSDLTELSRCVQPMLGALPKHYRDALELTDLGGMGQREAASLRQLSLSGMKSRVQRARRQVKEMMLQRCQIELDRCIVPLHQTKAQGCCDWLIDIAIRMFEPVVTSLCLPAMREPAERRSLLLSRGRSRTGSNPFRGHAGPSLFPSKQAPGY